MASPHPLTPRCGVVDEMLEWMRERNRATKRFQDECHRQWALKSPRPREAQGPLLMARTKSSESPQRAREVRDVVVHRENLESNPEAHILRFQNEGLVQRTCELRQALEASEGALAVSQETVFHLQRSVRDLQSQLQSLVVKHASELSSIAVLGGGHDEHEGQGEDGALWWMTDPYTPEEREELRRIREASVESVTVQCSEFSV